MRRRLAELTGWGDCYSPRPPAIILAGSVLVVLLAVASVAAGWHIYLVSGLVPLAVFAPWWAVLAVRELLELRASRRRREAFRRHAALVLSRYERETPNYPA